ncbi:hypothetical protein GCM10022200_18350 [Microbacterium awajiense]|uniref:Glycosyl transferase family 11 n=2 Tax=Microbacterium awajiense TaxID=415214 RepID=A0ABP7AL88_9MICO
MLRRGDRVVVMTPLAGLRFGNWLYLWLDAHQRAAAGEPTRVLEAPGMAMWLDEFPRLRKLTVSASEMRFHDRREWNDDSWTQRFGIDFDRVSVDAFVRETLIPELSEDLGDTLVVNVRRGDYYSDPVHRKRYGWDVPGYLAEALGRTARAERVRVVSDDAHWCREHLDTLLSAHSSQVDYDEPDPVANFRAIAAARRLIGTNSTFSYWGGYVAGARFDSPEVIMPRFHGRFEVGTDAYQLDPKWTVIDGHH